MVQEREMAVGQAIDSLSEITHEPMEQKLQINEENSPGVISESQDTIIGAQTKAPTSATIFLETNSDSVETISEPVYGIILSPPDPHVAAPSRYEGGQSVSFILCGLFLLFLICALRFRNNYKYVISMFRDLVETRTRHNVFDDTVSETSLLVLLNILWCGCAGIVAFCVYNFLYPAPEIINRGLGMLIGMGVASIYSLFMWGGYAAVGWIFSDREHSELWVKGYSSSQALMAPAFFLTALIAICQPSVVLNVGIISGCVFILTKFLFIWKGYRIFFNQFSSWVLFLCYLCSLEIIPLILCYRSARLLSEVL